MDLLLEHSEVVFDLALVEVFVVHAHRNKVLDHFCGCFLNRVALILIYDAFVHNLKLFPFFLLS